MRVWMREFMDFYMVGCIGLYICACLICFWIVRQIRPRVVIFKDVWSFPEIMPDKRNQRPIMSTNICKQPLLDSGLCAGKKNKVHVIEFVFGVARAMAA